MGCNIALDRVGPKNLECRSSGVVRNDNIMGGCRKRSAGMNRPEGPVPSACPAAIREMEIRGIPALSL